MDWKHADVLKTSWCLLQSYVTIKSNILKPPWWLSSTRHVHKTTRRPPEDQSSWRFQVHSKHEDVLKTPWCLLQGCYVTITLNILKPNWWRLQHVMFIWSQEAHRRPVLMTFAIGLEACRRLDAFSGLCHYQIKYFKAPLVTSSTRHVHKTTRRPPKTKCTWSMKMCWRHLDAFFRVTVFHVCFTGIIFSEFNEFPENR